MEGAEQPHRKSDQADEDGNSTALHNHQAKRGCRDQPKGDCQAHAVIVVQHGYQCLCGRTRPVASTVVTVADGGIRIQNQKRNRAGGLIMRMAALPARFNPACEFVESSPGACLCLGPRCSTEACSMSGPVTQTYPHAMKNAGSVCRFGSFPGGMAGPPTATKKAPGRMMTM
ncbi:hypothetical protein SDC9_138265 [bioreactor metagenome]|uniref:Uncharacterized protein n=1 Tax=bioreactor metagenome TaxID=1076179 RepID=A0A645DPJ3_9ZZZZ